jgi:hypothetical protein
MNNIFSNDINNEWMIYEKIILILFFKYSLKALFLLLIKYVKKCYLKNNF